MKFIDCSASIGLASVNKYIVNHEDYIICEKVDQAANADELLKEMDRCGVDEACVYHQSVVDVAPTYGNEQLLSDPKTYTGRLKAVLAMLPSITDKEHTVEKLLEKMQKYNVFGLRAFPKADRYMLDRITCGDTLDMLTEKKVPLYLSPNNDWEHIFAVMKEFPKLTVIITNYGLWGSDRFFYPLVNAYKNVYVDTSDFQEVRGIEAFVNKFGSERMLFGSNFPSDNIGGPMTTLIGAKISANDKENIAHANAERLWAENLAKGGVK
ncbi:MAG: amidohydrolase family protein [Clostridia bacterium]|nr:amidohydrolase family protein [Clostridia bacterium]